jgi:DNA-binding SARP family transcriptional activator
MRLVITCRLLGPAEITVDGRQPPPDLLWRKNLALLVYLSRSPKRTRTREHLMGLLWGEKSESSARHSLREAIRILRRGVGPDGLSAEHDQVRLADGAVHLDTEDFEHLEAAADWRAAANLIAGDFLEGFGVPDASPFEDWLATERETWKRRALAALVAGAEDVMGRGRTPEAADWALRALHLDAGSEHAARAAMKALAIQGNRAGALACFERLRARLDEVGTEPSADTHELAQRIQRERTWQLSDDVPAEPERGAESRRAPLVGREDALARLLDPISRGARERQPCACVVLADAGLGKSRLLDEVVARARLDGAAATVVRAVEADLSQPWSGVLGLGRGGLLAAKGVAAAPANALAAFAAEIPDWADSFGVRGMQPASLGNAVSAVLRAAAEEQPVVVVVDDAHWLDRDSFLALVASMRDASTLPVSLVLAACAEPSREEVETVRASIGRDLQGTTVQLEPLDDAAIRDLARWAIPSYSDDEVDRLARRVAVDSAGFPLLAMEILHAVALGLDLGTIDGAWPEPQKTLDQSLPSELPDAVVAAIRVGFRRLSKPAQQVLAAAAVLGDRVSPDMLKRATDIADDQLHAALDELEWQRWLVAEPRGYGFVARIVKGVIGQDMLTEGQRRRIVEKTR